MKLLWLLALLFSAPLNAATLDILDNPYKVMPPSLLRQNNVWLDWSGSVLDFETLAASGATTGAASLQIGGTPKPESLFLGKIEPSREFSLATFAGNSLVLLDGIFSSDYDRAFGRVLSLDNTDTIGFFELQAVSLPASFILLLSAGSTLLLFTRNRQ